MSRESLRALLVATDVAPSCDAVVRAAGTLAGRSILVVSSRG
ncbi:MAG TPA: hypothetical protein VM617_02225 [Thermoanaerobaculia bacterium]|nr:hypothetical protein [Thermoanaerobaculia bacterium]